MGPRSPRNVRRNSILITYHYPDLVSAVEWLKIWTADFQRDTKTKNSLRNRRFIL